MLRHTHTEAVPHYACCLGAYHTISSRIVRDKARTGISDSSIAQATFQQYTEHFAGKEWCCHFDRSPVPNCEAEDDKERFKSDVHEKFVEVVTRVPEFERKLCNVRTQATVPDQFYLRDEHKDKLVITDRSIHRGQFCVVHKATYFGQPIALNWESFPQTSNECVL